MSKIRFKNLETSPDSPSAGFVYLFSKNNKLYIRSNSGEHEVWFSGSTELSMSVSSSAPSSPVSGIKMYYMNSVLWMQTPDKSYDIINHNVKGLVNVGETVNIDVAKNKVVEIDYNEGLSVSFDNVTVAKPIIVVVNGGKIDSFVGPLTANKLNPSCEETIGDLTIIYELFFITEETLVYKCHSY